MSPSDGLPPKDTAEKYPFLMTRTPYGIGPYKTEEQYRSNLGPNPPPTVWELQCGHVSVDVENGEWRGSQCGPRSRFNAATSR